MHANPVVWFEIYVQDMERAKRFYESVFRLELERMDSPGLEMWRFPSSNHAPGAGGALARMEGFAPGGNSTLVYFRCDDCADEASRAVECGGRIQQAKRSLGEYGFMALVVDTEGNMLGLHSRH